MAFVLSFGLGWGKVQQRENPKLGSEVISNDTEQGVRKDMGDVAVTEK